jgi:hypothetical protein
MNRSFLLSLASAPLVFVIGSGLDRAPSPANPEGTVLVRDADGRPLPVLPTVIVSATAPHEALDATTGVLLDEAMLEARTAIAGAAGSGIRRVGLAIPYYAFGRNARSTE